MLERRGGWSARVPPSSRADAALLGASRSMKWRHLATQSGLNIIAARTKVVRRCKHFRNKSPPASRNHLQCRNGRNSASLVDNCGTVYSTNQSTLARKAGSVHARPPSACDSGRRERAVRARRKGRERERERACCSRDRPRGSHPASLLQTPWWRTSTPSR